MVIDNSSFIPGHQRSFVYTRSLAIPCLYQGEASYSHQWPRCGERFFGLYTPEERFLGRLRVWRLGERDPCLSDDSGQRVSSNCPGSEVSTMVGGHSTLCRAAASGRAASYFQLRVRTSGSRQRVDYAWPLTSSDPHFSLRISHRLFV